MISLQTSACNDIVALTWRDDIVVPRYRQRHDAQTDQLQMMHNAGSELIACKTLDAVSWMWQRGNWGEDTAMLYSAMDSYNRCY